jgi:membrane carboxypeptidase/penicillin-binding protein
LQPDLQRETELALQEGLASYEKSAGRVEFQGPELNLSDAVERIGEGKEADAPADPAWLQAMKSAHLAHDVQWNAALVIEKQAARRGEGAIRVGLADGRVLPLSGSPAILRRLRTYDVVLVHVAEGKGRGTARAELRVRPVVQGAAVVLENKTGRILAMAGGLSYAESQLNRVIQSYRQPGSALKPLTYLAALQKGLQPNTFVRDREITLAPINASKRRADYWSPKNYDGRSLGVITLRSALENSRNLATANLLDGGIAGSAPESLDQVCALAVQLKIYKECERYYPFVLGAQPVRPIDLAQFYATIANEGQQPSPHAIEAIEQNGEVVYRHPSTLEEVRAPDRASFYQLKTMLQGVVARGTARGIGALAPYVAGKTGTTEDENDAWFVGFSNDVTVAVWVGYDNADGRRRTLGSGQTGASVALPIFEPIMQAVWTYQAPRRQLDPPSSEAMRLLVAEGSERHSRRDRSRDGSLVEYIRRDARGRPVDARYALTSRGEGEAATSGFVSRTRRQAPAAVPNAPPNQAPPQSPWGWGGWGWNQRNERDANRGSYPPNANDRPSPYARSSPYERSPNDRPWSNERSPYERRSPFFFRDF